jgi:DNA mismatch endonuclease (patch repair protein)
MADNKTKAQRSYNMSRIRGMDTAPELAVRRAAYTRGLRYRTHNMKLPGRPDMVFAGIRVLVFIDGDFWHGWQFPRWRSRLSPFWQAKIERNRKRDVRNFAKLRRAGWTIVRIWEHDVHRDLAGCVDRITDVVARQRMTTV